MVEFYARLDVCSADDAPAAVAPMYCVIQLS